MAGKTVSAYVSDEVAEHVALEAKRDDRSPAQIAGLALRFFVSLPREARASVAALYALGTQDECRQVMNEVARVLNIAEFDMTCRRLSGTAATLVPDNAPDDELEHAAIELTRSALKRRG
ncbi:MAG: hypothetical protein EXR07_08175 [Acetobacteraceae bacterium]|nr:hypothetical protein [Acetobacteraceae bacterium]